MAQKGLSKPLVLVGMMGCGKSSLLRELSTRFAVVSKDTDVEIEERAGVSIPEIFHLAGEEEFRRREHKVLKDLLETKVGLLATGGGIVVKTENRELLKNSDAHVVYLKVSPEKAFERIRFSNRPLLQNEDPLGTLKKLTESRSPYYEEVSSIVIDVSEMETKEVADKLLCLLENLQERESND